MYDLNKVAKAIGLKLYALWQESGLDQASFARKIGISLASFYSYVYGRRTPTLTSLVYIANALDVSISYLLDDKKTEFNQLPARGLNWKMALYLCENCAHSSGDRACVTCKIKKATKEGKHNG